MILSKPQRILWIPGLWLLVYLPVQWQAAGQPDSANISDYSTQQPPGPSFPLASISFTLFENDSIADIQTELGRNLATIPLIEGPELHTTSLFEKDHCYLLLENKEIAGQGWDTLRQVQFWRQIMRLKNDTALISLPGSRRILGGLAWKEWREWDEIRQNKFKDSIRMAFALDTTQSILITFGKRHYYLFDRTIPTIEQGINVFEQSGVDPWYAQAILLIESPGQLARSPVGAYGSFQLMETVAREQGLIVNDSVDEREDFHKAAWGASRLLATRCIPQARRMMQKWQLPYEETDIWFRLIVLHIYHAGAGNVAGVLNQISPVEGGLPLIEKLWKTEYGGFKNASQNYSQLALASLLELEQTVQKYRDTVCFQRHPYVLAGP